MLMFIAELTALIIGIWYARKDNSWLFFIAYIIFDFCILLADWYLIADIKISYKIKFDFRNLTNTLIAFVELLVYYSYFGKILDGNKIKKCLIFLITIYSLTIIFFIATKFDFLTTNYGYVADIIGATEFVFLLVPCVYYFLQLLKANSTLRLTERPSFWIVTGIFFYALISIPNYLLHRHFINIHYEIRYLFVAVLYYFPFTANFIFLIKAFLCKKTLTI